MVQQFFYYFCISGFRNLGKFEPGSVFASEAAKTSPGSNFPKIPEISATMAPLLIDARILGILENSSLAMFWHFQLHKFWRNWSLAVFSHPKLPKHRQARISPKFARPEMPKPRQARISPKFPKSWNL